jgi:hypothetical protein
VAAGSAKAKVTTLPENVGAAVCISPETITYSTEERDEKVIEPLVSALAAERVLSCILRGPTEKDRDSEALEEDNAINTFA